MLVAGGSTNVTTYFALRKTADGTAATGLTITDIDLQYVRSGAAPSTKADATALAATDSAHGDNQAIEIDATDAPGLYRVDWPDAAFAAGVREVILTVKVATAFTEHLRVEIDGEVNVVEWAGTDVTISSTTAKPEVDVNSISDDATAANNLELDYDGTGYNKSNSTIGTTTTNTDMRGTDSAALASVVGALADAAAAGDPTVSDTIVAYIKQLINVLVGTTGVTTFPAEAAPANNVNLAEVIRAIYTDTNANTAQTGDSFARLGAPAGASVSADIAAVQADLPTKITKNTALSNFEFLMVLSSDHVTGATGLTVTAERSIDGGAFAAAANSVTEVANGIYKIDLAASDLNGDVITLKFTAATADARFVTIVTQAT